MRKVHPQGEKYLTNFSGKLDIYDQRLENENDGNHMNGKDETIYCSGLKSFTL